MCSHIKVGWYCVVRCIIITIIFHCQTAVLLYFKDPTCVLSVNQEAFLRQNEWFAAVPASAANAVLNPKPFFGFSRTPHVLAYQ